MGAELTFLIDLNLINLRYISWVNEVGNSLETRRKSFTIKVEIMPLRICEQIYISIVLSTFSRQILIVPHSRDNEDHNF